MKLEFSWQIFEKYSNNKFHENPASGSRVVSMQQTDMTGPIVPLHHGSPTFYGKGPHPLLWAGSRAARGKIAVNSIPNRPNYCVLFTLCTWFANVVAGRTIQPGGPLAFRGPRVGDPCFTQCYVRAKQNWRTEYVTKKLVFLNMDTIFIYLIITLFLYYLRVYVVYLARLSVSHNMRQLFVR
jgi:hypothetical protein